VTPARATAPNPLPIIDQLNSPSTNDRIVSMMYVTRLNVAAISIGLVNRSRGTKLRVRKRSGKKMSPAEWSRGLRLVP